MASRVLCCRYPICFLTIYHWQSLEGEGEGGSDASILDVAAFAFVAVGGTLLVFIRVGIPSAFVK
eukprot:232647-Rhodomonas_salina.2